MIALIRIRGSIGTRHDIKQTFKMLRLKTCNQLCILPETQTIKGMLKKVENYSTFGAVEEKTLAALLQKRGRIAGNKKISQEFLKERNVNSFEELAKGMIGGKIALKNLGIKPVFRLSPPRKGFERAGIKKPFKLGGALGDRRERINALIERMM